MDKPSVFIGSSKEGLLIAEALFSCLSHETRPKLWTNEIFLPGQYPMESLESQVHQHDFAVLIASPDDQILKRGNSSPAIRDNLLLEFGMFAGVLGRKRVFFVCPDHPKVDLPSDLFGIIMSSYSVERTDSSHDELAAAVQVPCQQIRAVIREEWALIQQSKARLTDNILASEMGKAIEHLYSLITELRDALMVVQRDALAAVSDEYEFERVRKLAITKVKSIITSFADDAELVGVSREVDLLSSTTLAALADLPFPEELATGKSSKQISRTRGLSLGTISTGLGALETMLGGGGAILYKT